MEYNSLFEPLLCICLSMCLGFLIGTAVALTRMSREQKEMSAEIDKFRGLYFDAIERVDDYEIKYGSND